MAQTRNNPRFDKQAGFVEAFPKGNTFQCQIGFVFSKKQRTDARYDCIGRFCRKEGMKCRTDSKRARKSGVTTVTAPRGYTMTGGGLVNHYRHWNKRAHFERSHPHDGGGNGWTGDMGFGWGDYTTYVRSCTGVTCVTRQSGVGNSMKVYCPKGYNVMSCGSHQMNGWGKLGAFEKMIFTKTGEGCDCDMGFGHGRDRCFARCCK